MTLGFETPAQQAARYTRLYVKLLQLFPKNTGTLTVPYGSQPSGNGIHIYIDLSNIYIAFNETLESLFKHYFPQQSGHTHQPEEEKSPLKQHILTALQKHPYSRYVHLLDIAALNHILQRGRRVKTKSLCGSVPRSHKNEQGNDGKHRMFVAPSYHKDSKSVKKQVRSQLMSSVYETMLDEARNSGYSVTIMSRVAIEGNDKKAVTSPEEGSSVKSKHKELGVDEMLSFQILQTVLERDKVNSRNSSSSKDSKDSKDSLHSQYVVFPKLDGDNNKNTNTIVLVTGDGQPSGFTTFSKDSPLGHIALRAGVKISNASPSSSSDISVSQLGFYSVIEKALQLGWSVELYSFGHSLSYNWSKLAKTGSLDQARFRIIYLDEFVFELAKGGLARDLQEWLSDN